MKKLNEIINCEYDVLIGGIKTNSFHVVENDLFVCVKGFNVDRHLFIDDAIKKGAKAVIVQKDIEPKSVPIIKVDDPNQTLSEILPKFYDDPLSKMKLIGVTGTDGKTSVATIIATLIGDDNCGYIGTNGIKCQYFQEKTTNSTPDIDVLYPVCNKFLQHNIHNVAIEVSSEAVYHGRINSLLYDCAILTNITKEHLNTHKNLDNYIACKSKLFTQTKKDGFCILNKDDEHYQEILNNCNGQVVTYGLDQDNTLQIKDIKLLSDKTIFTICYQKKDYLITSPLLALFNVYNLAASLLTLLTLDYDIETIISRIPLIKIDGRLTQIDLDQEFKVFIDYAHTPNGIEKLLQFMNSIKHNRIILVFSEPGERDKSKRPEKGYNAITNVDWAIISSQDPRDEDPLEIANDLTTLVKDKNNYEIIIDRNQAIKKAINMAKKNDIVLIIGKGNETYQILKDKVIEFSDIEQATIHLKEKLKK